MYPALGRLLGLDPALVEMATLKDAIQGEILKRQLPPSALSNGIHMDLSQLKKEGRLSILEVTELQATWVLGRCFSIIVLSRSEMNIWTPPKR